MTSERHELGQAIDALVAQATDPKKRTQKYWTVLKEERDPYRMDRPANHRDCQWLVERWDALGIAKPQHDRGLHYGFLGTPMPVGRKGWKPNAAWIKKHGTNVHPSSDPLYRNTFWHSSWIEDVVKRARWLEYVDWDDITEERNGEPEFTLWTELDPPEGSICHPKVDIEANALSTVVLPDADGLFGEPRISDFQSPQPYHLVLLGEKTSLKPILRDIAVQYGASLVLAKGDLTDPLVYKIAEAAAQDGRPIVVLYFSDSDMSGWHMSIVLSRKLAAAKLVLFPEIEFRVYRVGLVPDQVKELDLPQEPLKPNDKRGPKWAEATGTNATEIDALITRQPEVLRTMAHDMIANFFDKTLAKRTRDALKPWQSEVRGLIESHPDLAAVRIEVANRYTEIEAEASDLAAEIQRLAESVTEGVELPPIPDLPEAVVKADQPEPLCDSDWSFEEQTEVLLKAKEYVDEDDE